MAQFLKYVLATIVGVFITSIIFMLLMAGIFGSLSRSVQGSQQKVVPNSVLELNLNYAMPEQTNTDLKQNLNLAALTAEYRPGLNDILHLIAQAKEDNDIKGIYLKMGINPNGYAKIDEVRLALQDFKSSGKFIVAHGQFVSQRSYFLASVADAIYLHPTGMIDLKGFSAGITFYKGLLDKLGVKPVIFYDGRYKSATEPFRLNRISDDNRKQLRYFIDDYYSNYLKVISDSRDIDTEEIHRMASGLEAWDPNLALAGGLTDSLLFEDQVWDDMKRRLGLRSGAEFKPLRMETYLNHLKVEGAGNSDKLAIIYAEGDIVDGSGGAGHIGAATMAPLIRKARLDDNIKAIVLRVNSPGGSAPASDVIWREVKLAAENKTVVVSMGDLAASGGYFISCPADHIVAQPFTITGSIGVFFMMANVGELMEDKLGITFDTVKTAAMADFPNLSREFTDAENHLLQSRVDSTYMDFKRKVAQGRDGLDMDQVEQIAQGRIWTGSQALDRGLVDQLGNLDTAIAVAADLAGLREYRIIEMPEQEDNLMLDLLRSMNMSVQQNQQQAIEQMLSDRLGPFYTPFNTLSNFNNMQGMQARMPLELMFE